MDAELLRGFSLGDYLVEPLTGTVTGKDGPARHLPPKAVEVLLCLASRPHSLVSREELLSRVWRTGGGSQRALSHAVSELRHALDDQPDNPRFVQTVPKLGYRLLAEPRANGAKQTAPEPYPDPGADRGGVPYPPFVDELMRRGVVQAGLTYALAGWLLIQVADATFEPLGLPGWSLPFVTFVVIGGFPIVLVLSWFLEFAGGRLQWDTGSQSGRVAGALGRNYVAVVAAYVIAVLGATAYHLAVGFQSTEPILTAPAVTEEVVNPVQPNSIAVLRFLDISGDDRARVFSDGLAEDLLDRLARIPQLLVASRGDAWSLEPNTTSAEVRDRLRVAYYLEGSVRLEQSQLQIVVQLIDSGTGFHVVSRTFERTLQDFVAVQREITDLVIANLRVVLPEETQMVLLGTYERPDLDAYVLYRRGKEILDGPLSTESLAEAISLFEEALSLDPGFAAAHSGLCSAYAMGYQINRDSTYIDHAERTCAAALANNANLDMVYNALGELYRRTGRLPEAERAFLRALETNEMDVEALRGLAKVYASQQRAEEAEARFREAIALQPGNWKAINSLGAFYYNTGRYREAAAQFQRLVHMDGSNWPALTNLGTALMLTGDFEAAMPAFLKSIEIEPQWTAFSNLGMIHYYLGAFDESVATHRKAVELSPDYNVVWLNLADALFFSDRAGEAEEAFRAAAELAEARISVNPRDAEALFELAWAKAMLGEVERAEELIGRSMEIAPNDPYVYYYDGLLKTRQGRRQAAVDALAVAVELGYPVRVLAAEPYLQDLRGEARFAALVSGGDSDQGGRQQ